MQSLWMIVASIMFAGMGVRVKRSADAGYAAAEIVFSRSIVSLAIVSVIVYWRGVTLATAVTLNYSSPIFLMLLLMAFRGLRPNGGLVFSLGFGFAGVAFLLHPSLTEDAWFGGAMTIASALLAAMTYLDVRELVLRDEPEARTVFYFALLSTLFYSTVLFPTLFGVVFRGDRLDGMESSV
jgi:S-adenosylmethionine uptake transporter